MHVDAEYSMHRQCHLELNDVMTRHGYVIDVSTRTDKNRRGQATPLSLQSIHPSCPLCSKHVALGSTARRAQPADSNHGVSYSVRQGAGRASAARERLECAGAFGLLRK